MIQRTITVEKEACIHCGLCIRDCVAACLEFDEEKIPRYLPEGEQRCLACQHCMLVCPKGALSFGGLQPEQCGTVSYGTHEELLKLIKSRRSTRAYKKEDLSQEQLDKLTEMLAYAPTGVNAPSVRFSLVATRKKMDKIRKITYDCLNTVRADSPLFIIKEMAEASKRAGKDLVYRGAPALVVASVDTKTAASVCQTVDPVIALSYLELYAASLGLGTVWDGIAVALARTFPEIEAQFQIPQGCKLSFLMALGIPDISYQRTPQRTTDRITIIR